MANRIQKVSLEKVAIEKRSKQIIKAIDSVELEIWEQVESGLRLKVGERTTEFRLNYKISTKKFLAWLGV